MARWGSNASAAVSMEEVAAAAKAIVAAGRPLTKGVLGAALGISEDWARVRLARARREGYTELTIATERSAARSARIKSIEGYTPRPAPDRASAEGLNEVHLATFVGMGDGRHEDDDPRRIGGCFGHKGHAAAPMDNAQACRKYLREYRVIRGRAKAEPKPRELGKPCCWNTPRKPAKRRDNIMFGKQVQRHLHAN
jgi:hypothetical protein